MSKKKKNKNKKQQSKKKNDLLAEIEELEVLKDVPQNTETNKKSNKKISSAKKEKVSISTEIEEEANEISESENKPEKKEKKTKNPKKKNDSEQNNNLKKDDFDKKEEKTKEDGKEILKEEKSNKAIIKVEKPENPTLLEQAEQSKKRSFILIIVLIALLMLILFFSVIFALINVSKSVIIKGVSIKNTDVSNMSITEAKDKLTKNVDIELNSIIRIKSDNYETTLTSDQIEFSYDLKKATEDAYSVGRKGNIFQNNYTILKSNLFGENVNLDYSYNKNSLKDIVNDIESKIPGIVEEASYYQEGSELIIVPGKDGIIVDKEKLEKRIIDTILSANANNLIENKKELEVEIPIEQAKAKEIDIDKIYKEIYTDPKDAYFEADPFKIYKEVDGVDFAISKDEAKKLVKEKQGEYRIPLTITPAEKTINDIGLEAFPYLISEFTTKYDASNINRSQNLSIAAGKIDGTVLMPGEEFSFNQVVGKRTIQEGYKDAKIYQDGQVVDGLAGGICQISSTLYNAVVKANLEVTERRNHSFTTSYIRAGQDATVVYGVVDFKFKNTRTYPIKISASVNSGIAGFKINGIKEETEYEISLSPVTTGTIPYGTQYIPDPTLAPGQQITVQRGASGLRVTTYKDTKLDGKLVSREVFTTDTYTPMKAIIRVGP